MSHSLLHNSGCRKLRIRDVSKEIGAPDNRINGYQIACSDAPGFQISCPVTRTQDHHRQMGLF
jgi:hypothetical protein